MTSFFLQDVCCWSEGALDLMDDGDLCPVVDMRVGEMIFWHGCFIVNSWGKVLKCLHWFHLCSRTRQPVQSTAQEIFKMTLRLYRKERGLFKRTCNLKTYYLSKLLSCMDNCFKVRIKVLGFNLNCYLFIIWWYLPGLPWVGSYVSALCFYVMHCSPLAD